MHYNAINNSYQQASIFNFVPFKQFGQLMTIAPYPLTMNFNLLKYGLQIKTMETLKLEDNTNMTLIIGTS